MISQSDIIRTLVNKNCTDESIMSTALSLGCTPAKLLEKFTEAERFDLALDVSMKLGLDTVPLWRTWALRCLRNRNFTAARDKFKLCFQRLKPHSGRSSIETKSSSLLSEILKILTRMEEDKPSLNEEIECIKRQSFNLEVWGDKRIDGQDLTRQLDKPTIYNECIYYLKEYGTVKDHIRFYVKHSSWDRLVESLIENRQYLDTSTFFITDVFLKSASVGHLEDLISGFLRSDVNLVLSRQYFRSIYEYCISHQHNNLLYYIQHKIGDFVAAAENQINNFFLKKPACNYQELNYRLGSLAKAIDNYKSYLRKLNDKKHIISMKNDLKRRDVVKNDLYSEMRSFNVEIKISTIELQVDITRNFSLNEVSGCIQEIEFETYQDITMRAEDKFPVTLFDRSERRKTFLAALVLIYFDPECSCYFSSKGMDLAKRLIHKLQLDKLNVFKMAMRIILEDESCNILESTSLLLERLRQEYEEDVKLVLRRPINKPQSKPLAKTVKNLTRHPQEKASPRQSIQESEKISLLSNNSILSSTTTTSSSSTSSSCSPLPATNVSLGSSPRPQFGVTDRSRLQTSTSAALQPTPPQESYERKSSLSLATPQASQVLVRNSSSSRLSAAGADKVETSKTMPIKITAKGPPSAHHAGLYSTTATNHFGLFESSQALCDEVIRDSIKCCREADYKMELAKLLSPKAKIELYIELGKLSNAQHLAFNLSCPDYVVRIMNEAEKLNQNHVKTVCQHWLAKHESQNLHHQV